MSAVLQVPFGPQTSALVSARSRRWKQTVGDNYGFVTREKILRLPITNYLSRDGILKPTLVAGERLLSKLCTEKPNLGYCIREHVLSGREKETHSSE